MSFNNLLRIYPKDILVVFAWGPTKSGNCRIQVILNILKTRVKIHFYIKPDGRQHFPSINKRMVHTEETLSPATPAKAEAEWQWARENWKNNPGIKLENLSDEARAKAILLAIEIWNKVMINTGNPQRLQYVIPTVKNIPSAEPEVKEPVTPNLVLVHPAPATPVTVVEPSAQTQKWNAQRDKTIAAKAKKPVVKNNLGANLAEKDPNIFDKLKKIVGH